MTRRVESRILEAATLALGLLGLLACGRKEPPATATDAARASAGERAVAAAATPAPATRVESAPIDPDAAVLVGVVTREGMLIPFASYQRGRWEVAKVIEAAQPPGDTYVPTDLLKGLAGSTWYSPDENGKLRVLKAGTVVPLQVDCNSNWALTTDRSGDTPPGEFTGAGEIAANARVEGGAVQDGAGGVEDERSLSALALASFDALETEEIPRQARREADDAAAAAKRKVAAAAAVPAGASTGIDAGRKPSPTPSARGPLRAEMTPAERAAIPVQMTRIMRAAIDSEGSMIFRVEAKRQYAVPVPGRCPEESLLQGWAVKDRNGLRWINSGVAFANCDYVDVRSQTPLGALHFDAKTFLVVEEHGYEDTEIAIFEIKSESLKEVVTAGQGGC